MPVDPSKYDETVAAIEKAYGKGVIRSGSKDPEVLHIPTGSYELDHITGKGVPMGRVSRFYGGWSSAKSLTCWNVVKNAHRFHIWNPQRFPNGLEVIYYNLEKQFDRRYCEQLGVDVKRLKVVDADTVEDCGTMLHDLLDSAHLHIVDSCSSVPTLDELNKSLHEHTMGVHAKAWGKVLRRVVKSMDARENGIILVDQIRDVFNSGSVAPPGGRSMEHASSMSLMFRRGGWLHRDDNGILDPDAKALKALSELTEPEGIEIQVRVEKSRVCRPLRSARMRLDLKTGEWDLIYELTKAGAFFDEDGAPAYDSGKAPIIAQPSTGRYMLQDGTKIHGKKKLRLAVEQDPELQQRIVNAMMKSA
jgi:RecA/RadA recombinase